MPLPAPTRHRHRTKQEFVYQTLRDAIMRCELAPDERLVIDELARRLEVSIIPVREALQQLQAEGLVIAVPHIGVSVAPVSRESIQDVFTVLEGLEVATTGLVAEQPDLGRLAPLAELVARMDAAAEEERYDQWADLNTQFHLGISALAGLPLLREITERVLAHWGRLRRYFFRGVLVHRVGQAQEEHRAILAALRDGDVERVRELARRHNRGALDAYLAYLDHMEADAGRDWGLGIGE